MHCAAFNVAAPLEQSAPPGDILIGAPTLELARDAVTVEALEPLELKGKAEPVAAFRIVGIDAGAPGLVRRLDTPMVGREYELGLLRGAFENVVRRRMCALFTV